MPALPLEDDIPFKVKYTLPRPPKNKPRPSTRKRKNSVRRRSRQLSISSPPSSISTPINNSNNSSGLMSPAESTNGRATDTAEVGMMTDDHQHNGNGVENGNENGYNTGGEAVIQRAVVRPNAQWMALRRYKNFVRKDETFSINDYVFVENPNADRPHHLSSDTESDSDSPSTPTSTSSSSARRARKPRRWIARVDEICASETPPDRVFLRVSWLYRPEDLPGGRQYYHGKGELVMSNHVDVVDALSVSGRADVKRWRELDEEDDGLELYWRQEVDVISGALSEIRTHCTCHQRYNPDRLMLRCEHCRLWLHEECVVSDILRRHSAASKAARRASGRNHSISTSLALTSLNGSSTSSNGNGNGITSKSSKRKSLTLETGTNGMFGWAAGGEREDEQLESLRRELRPRLVVEKGVGNKGVSKRNSVNGDGGGGGGGRPRVQMRRKVWGAGSEGGIVWEDVECLRCRRRVE